jgi:hypothetical protein
MATTAGALSKVAIGETTASLLSAAASGGTGPYTYQWHRSTTTGFTPSGGTAISGATSLSLSDTGLSGATQYYYKVVATDSGSVSGTSSQLAVLTAAASQSPNQFAQSEVLGQVDFNPSVGVQSVQVLSTESATIVAGECVSVNAAGSTSGVPKVVKTVSASDAQIIGFVAYNVKSKSFVADDALEIAKDGSVMYLQATEAINANQKVVLDLVYKGGVKPSSSGSSGDVIVGYALETKSAGQLIRIQILTPSFVVV